MRSIKFDQLQRTPGAPAVRPSAPPPAQLAAGSGSFQASELLEEAVERADLAAGSTPATLAPAPRRPATNE